MILVDTSIWIDWFRGKETWGVIKLNHALENRLPLAICGVILSEILQGVKAPRELAEVEKILRPLTYLEISREDYVLAAALSRTAKQKGFTIRSLVDCIIAAVALKHDAVLLENDRDYQYLAHCSGLKLIRE